MPTIFSIFNVQSATSVWTPSLYLCKMLTPAHHDAVEVPIYWRLVLGEILILFNCWSRHCWGSSSGYWSIKKCTHWVHSLSAQTKCTGENWNLIPSHALTLCSVCPLHWVQSLLLLSLLIRPQLSDNCNINLTLNSQAMTRFYMWPPVDSCAPSGEGRVVGGC